MPTHPQTPASLITLSKQNPRLRYVTIRAGQNNTEIYIFKYKKHTAQEGQTNNFWFAFITPAETLIILGPETTRSAMNQAHTFIYFEQQHAARLTPPKSFVLSIDDTPPKSYPLALILKNLKK